MFPIAESEFVTHWGEDTLTVSDLQVRYSVVARLMSLGYHINPGTDEYIVNPLDIDSLPPADTVTASYYENLRHRCHHCDCDNPAPYYRDINSRCISCGKPLYSNLPNDTLYLVQYTNQPAIIYPRLRVMHWDTKSGFLYLHPQVQADNPVHAMLMQEYLDQTTPLFTDKEHGPHYRLYYGSRLKATTSKLVQSLETDPTPAYDEIYIYQDQVYTPGTLPVPEYIEIIVGN